MKRGCSFDDVGGAAYHGCSYLAETRHASPQWPLKKSQRASEPLVCRERALRKTVDPTTIFTPLACVLLLALRLDVPRGFCSPPSVCHSPRCFSADCVPGGIQIHVPCGLPIPASTAPLRINRSGLFDAVTVMGHLCHFSPCVVTSSWGRTEHSTEHDLLLAPAGPRPLCFSS